MAADMLSHEYIVYPNTLQEKSFSQNNQQPYPPVDNWAGQWNTAMNDPLCFTYHVTALSHVMWLLLFSIVFKDVRII